MRLQDNIDFTAHESNALFTRPDDTASFTEQLGRIIQDTGLRQQLSRNARRTAELRGWDAIYDQLEHDYRLVVLAHRGLSRAA